MVGSYGALLARPKPRRLIAGLCLAWLSFGMVGLAIFLTTREASRSYGLAGIALAAFSLGSGVIAPLRGRLLDRRGTRPWLLAFAGGYAAGLLGLDGLAQMSAPAWTLIVCASASGASAPPLIATLRALWASAVDEMLLRRAYALTSILGDIGLVAAPALAGLLYVWLSWLPLAVCALSVVGAAAVVSGSSQPPDGQGAAMRGSPILSPNFIALLMVEAALGAALGLVEVAVPTAAARWRATAYSGVLLAAFSFGSLLGSVWFGRRQWHATPERRYLVAALLVAFGFLPLAASTSPSTLAPLLALAGLSYGPATVSLFEAVDDLAPTRGVEAVTWMTTSGAIGAAAGSAAAGWTTTSLGLWAAFASASIVLGAAAGIGLARSRHSRERNIQAM